MVIQIVDGMDNIVQIKDVQQQIKLLIQQYNVINKLMVVFQLTQLIIQYKVAWIYLIHVKVEKVKIIVQQMVK